jgi:hypothetical protein
MAREDAWIAGVETMWVEVVATEATVVEAVSDELRGGDTRVGKTGAEKHKGVGTWFSKAEDIFIDGGMISEAGEFDDCEI